jgi:transcriptional regulator NrdR family protein
MMYEADETPKECPKCKNTSSRVNECYKVKTENVKRRIRTCNNCANRYVTNTVIDDRFI